MAKSGPKWGAHLLSAMLAGSGCASFETPESPTLGSVASPDLSEMTARSEAERVLTLEGEAKRREQIEKAIKARWLVECTLNLPAGQLDATRPANVIHVGVQGSPGWEEQRRSFAFVFKGADVSFEVRQSNQPNSPEYSLAIKETAGGVPTHFLDHEADGQVNLTGPIWELGPPTPAAKEKFDELSEAGLAQCRQALGQQVSEVIVSN